MRFFDYFKLAYKNLTRQRTRTILTIIAITVGSLSLILMASVIISIRQSIVDQFQKLGAFSLVTVTKDPNSTNNDSLIGAQGDPSEGKKIDDTTLAAIKKLPHVADATPTANINSSTMQLEGGQKKTWGNITAIDPTTNVFTMSIVAGRNLQAGDLDKIVISDRFAREVGYQGKLADLVGKKVVMNSKMGGGSGIDWGPPPEQPPMNADKSWFESKQKEGTPIQAEIVGVVSNGGLDNGGSYVTLTWAHRLMTMVQWQYNQELQKLQDQQKNTNNRQSKAAQQQMESMPQMVLTKQDMLTQQGYNGIVIKADDQANIGKIASAVTALGYGANTAQTMLDQINRILLLISVVLAAIGGISLFVATIGIVNTMIMATYERTREIGVMRACGATKAMIRHLFTYEAALLGFCGGVFGIIISYTLGFIARIVMHKTGAQLGDMPINQIGNFPWWLIVAVIAFTTFIGMLAGLYPARRASKMNPVEALRYE